MTATVREPTNLGEVRAAQRRGRRGRRLLVLVLLTAVAVAVVWVVWFSSLLAVQRIEVRGTSTLPPDQVRAAAGVSLGTPLARVDDGAVADRLRALPRVGDVEVRRGWPHDLVLVVTERVAVAVVRTPDGLTSIDAAGEPVAVVADQGPLPLVKSGSQTGRAAALAVLASLPPAVKGRTLEVAASTRDDVTLTLKGGHRVRWGDVSRPADKAAVLAVLEKRPARLYDVSAPDFPVLTPA